MENSVKQTKRVSICQECFNFKCSWHTEFKPVEGWTAHPTIVSNGNQCVESYCVTECPQYKYRNGDGWRRVKTREIASILAFSMRQLFRHIESSNIYSLMESRGFEFKSFPNGKRHVYYIRRTNHAQRNI